MELMAFIKQSVEDVSLGRHKQSAIADDATILDDLGLDSLDYATIVLDCEAFTGIKVMDRDVDWAKIRSVKELASLFMPQVTQP